MKAQLNKLAQKLNSLQSRERRMLSITIVVLIMGVSVLISWQPLFVSWQKSRAELNVSKLHISQAKGDIESLKARVNVDANAPYKLQIKSLQSEFSKQQKQIENLTSALISPKKMHLVFTGLLQKNKMKMNKISNLDAMPGRVEGQKEETNLLYQHGLSLELKGDFTHALEYIQGIEIQDWQLYWDELTFSTLKYPMGILTIQAYTLSTSDGVLGL